MRKFLVGAALLATPVMALSACASGSGQSASGDPDVITSWQLAELQDMNAMEAIRRLRPGWLRIRSNQPRMPAGPDNPPPPEVSAAGFGSPYPRVHLDGVPLQDVNELENLRASDIREMRYLSGTDASTRFGTGYTNGVILVISEH